MRAVTTLASAFLGIALPPVLTSLLVGLLANSYPDPTVYLYWIGVPSALYLGWRFAREVELVWARKVLGNLYWFVYVPLGVWCLLLTDFMLSGVSL